MADVIFDLLGDPIPDGRGEPGRPEHLATDRNRSKVMLLLACGWTVKRIAGAMKLSAKTLRKHYSPQLRERDLALDRLKTTHLSLLLDQAQGGSTAATKELGKIIDRIDAARFGVHGDPRDEEDEPASRPRALGKKEEANLAARSAGEGSSWGNDLLPPHAKMN